MGLAFQLLTVASAVLVMWVMLMILSYWMCRACCPSLTPHPLTDVPRCTCSDLYVCGVVKDVNDGDGFSFSPHCPIHSSPKDISVRLAGIDAPAMPKPAQGEPGQPFAQEAADALAKLTRNKTLYIDKYGVERGIQFAWAFLPQEGSLPINVNLEMVKYGLADIWEGNGCHYGVHKAQIEQLLVEARDNRRGFWSLINKPNFKRPRDHKKQVRAQQTHKCKLPKSPPSKRKKSDKKSEKGKSKSQQECIVA